MMTDPWVIFYLEAGIDNRRMRLFINAEMRLMQKQSQRHLLLIKIEHNIDDYRMLEYNPSVE